VCTTCTWHGVGPKVLQTKGTLPVPVMLTSFRHDSLVEIVVSDYLFGFPWMSFRKIVSAKASIMM
jgi:hypothetical protein